MARGIRTSTGRGGRIAAPGGGYHGTSCAESCCGECAYVYRLRACAPNIEFPPQSTECVYVPPPDIYMCVGTLCESTGQPVQPTDVVLVNGVCYGVQHGQLPVSASQGAELYTLPTVQCLPLGCSDPGCLSSPFGRAIPCNPDCPPGPYFCRAQVPYCVTIPFVGGNEQDSYCCYRFDPGRAAAVPDGSVFCQLGRITDLTVPWGWPTANCDGFLFDPKQDFSIFANGLDACCECENECQWLPEIDADNDITCNAHQPITPRCCRVVPAGAVVRVRASTVFRFYTNGVQFFSQGFEDTGLLLGVPPPPGDSVDQLWEGDYVQQPMVNGQPSGDPSVVLARCFYCPLSLPEGATGERLLPPSRGWGLNDPAPGGVDENGWLVYCLTAVRRPWLIRNHWRHDRRDATLSGTVVEVFYEVRIDPTPRNPPIPCNGGCFRSDPIPVGRLPIGIIGTPVNPGAVALAAEGSAGGTITIRGGGSRDIGKINVAELL